MREWVTIYTHIDGSQWAGPSYWAETQTEAEAFAMDYPIQPLRVVGHLTSRHIDRRGGVHSSWLLTDSDTVH